MAASKKIQSDSKKEERKAGRFTVTLTNRNKLYWPELGITKGEMVDYYEIMSPYILPHLANRPLSLKRNPNGILDNGFFHKDAGENAPPFASVFKVKNESDGNIIDYLVCNNLATLLYVANLGCIEINPWNSTTRKTANPTWMVIDIDPSDKNSFDEVVDVALATREILTKCNVNCYCKTSGASGLHVYIPLKNKYDYLLVKDFAHAVALAVQQKLPNTTTLERSLKKRGPRIYLDYLQNRIGQTLASVYSLRPVAAASASTPLEWKEVKHGLDPSKFTIKSLPIRVKKRGDLFLPVLTESNDLRKAMKLLGQ